MSRKAAPAKNDSDLDIWAVSDYARKIPLCFEELSIWLARDFQLSFPFRNPVTSDIELFSLQSQYERPTLAYVLRHVRGAVVWFFGCCVDFGEVLFIGFNKVDLQVHRPADGIFIRLPCRTVQRCQGLLGEFVKGRPIRKVCDGLVQSRCTQLAGAALLPLCPSRPRSAPSYARKIHRAHVRIVSNPVWKSSC